MIRVTALTGSKHDPSSRFRIRQFVYPLAERDIAVAEYWPLISRYKIEPLPWLVAAMRVPGLLGARYSDVTWLGRELISGRFSLEPWAGKKRVFDVDDAIWAPYESDFSVGIVKHCAGVIAGNHFLAEHYQAVGVKVWLVPTAVDTSIWKPATARPNRPWTIGWSGSWANLEYLLQIERPLGYFLKNYPDSRLLVVCDRQPSFAWLPSDRWRFARWSAPDEARLVAEMDVGLMSLEDSEAARGKCGFKMLSYMATGLPVVVSPVGVNREIMDRGEVGLTAVTDDDWFQALEYLYQHRDEGAQMGAAGRRVVEEYYSVKCVAPKLADIFREVAAN